MWDPHKVKDKRAIENVQTFALKVVTSKCGYTYDELLELKPLEGKMTRAKIWTTLLDGKQHNNYALP